MRTILTSLTLLVSNIAFAGFLSPTSHVTFVEQEHQAELQAKIFAETNCRNMSYGHQKLDQFSLDSVTAGSSCDLKVVNNDGDCVDGFVVRYSHSCKIDPLNDPVM